jgi:hypothetical protein
MWQVIVCASLLLLTSTRGLPQEGSTTGPDLSGDYVLIRTTGDLVGVGPRKLHIVQTQRLFRVGTAGDDGLITWTGFPLKADWVDDHGNGKVKAYFSDGGVTTERAINLKQGYYRQLDRWTELSKTTIKVCKEAYARKSFWEELKQSGCAIYSRE